MVGAILHDQPEWDDDGHLVTPVPVHYADKPNLYDRMVYYRERVRALLGLDTAWTAEEGARLQQAYKEFGRPADLDKVGVQSLIKHAGLQTKRLLERHVSIRCFLTGRKCPAPPAWLLDQVTERFESVSMLWNAGGSIKNKPGSRTLRLRNIPPLDFILSNILLLVSQQAYDVYSKFLCTLRETQSLYILWRRFCERLGWPLRVPVSIRH